MAEFRAHGHCEICHERPDFRGLGGAHIEKRDYNGDNDTPANIIIACARCHNHDKYPTTGGLKIPKDKAREIMRLKNERYNIESRWRCLSDNI